MENKDIILIAVIVIVCIAILSLAAYFVLSSNDNNQDIVNNTVNLTNNITDNTTNLTDDDESSNSQSSSDSSSGDNGSHRLKENDTGRDGWNPKEHETYSEDIGNGYHKVHYDDGYYRTADSDGNVVSYGFA